MPITCSYQEKKCCKTNVPKHFYHIRRWKKKFKIRGVSCFAWWSWPLLGHSFTDPLRFYAYREHLVIGNTTRPKTFSSNTACNWLQENWSILKWESVHLRSQETYQEDIGLFSGSIVQHQDKLMDINPNHSIYRHMLLQSWKYKKNMQLMLHRFTVPTWARNTTATVMLPITGEVV